MNLQQFENAFIGVRGIRPNRGLYNNALHQAKRVGAPASQAVVEARFAGERECSAGGRGCS